MTKRTRKINRGLMLTILVSLGVVIYIIIMSSVRAQYKKEISKITEDYVSTVQSYSILPAQYRSGSEKMPDGEFDSFVEEMKTEVGKFCTDNEEALKTIISGIEANLISLKEGQNIVTEYEKSIKKLSYEFIDNKVTVSLTCKNKYRGSDYTADSDNSYQLSAEDTAPELRTISGETFDTVIFQKINGNWKIVYSYFSIPAEGYAAPF